MMTALSGNECDFLGVMCRFDEITRDYPTNLRLEIAEILLKDVIKETMRLRDLVEDEKECQKQNPSALTVDGTGCSTGIKIDAQLVEESSKEGPGFIPQGPINQRRSEMSCTAPYQELTDESLATMIALAREAALVAYAPYSCFKVGACIKTEGGRYVTGCNVENASYGLTICAERNAIFKMVSDRSLYEHSPDMVIRAIVIYTPTPTPSAPCGGCRQVINEFGTEETFVLSVCDGEETLSKVLNELLPHSFGPRNLGMEPVSG
jgi:cytidine deaminase